MISIDPIKNFYPAPMREQAGFLKHILKEYVQLLVLDYVPALTDKAGLFVPISTVRRPELAGIQGGCGQVAPRG